MTPERLKQLDNVYMDIAEKVSTMSLGKRNKVGAVLVKDNNIISFGWNGMPSGMPNDWMEFDGKTNPLVIHGEANAILKCAHSGNNTNQSTLYCTMSPCIECTKLILQAGISRVFYREQYRDDIGIAVLKQNNVKIEKL